MLMNKWNDPSKSYSCSLLHAAIKSKYYNFVNLLINTHGANIHNLDSDGRTTLKTTAYTSISVSEDNISLVKKLIDAGVDIRLENKHGHTALYALLKTNKEIFSLLVENGAEEELKEKWNEYLKTVRN